MIFKKIDEIEADDINYLIDNEIRESKSLEYKCASALPAKDDKSKKEFLAEISAFGNTIGGDLIIGIKEKEDHKGVPQSIDGVQIADVDQEILRLENIIRDGLEPRLVGIRIKEVKIPNDKFVIVIRVPRSWQSPHRVSFKGHSKFYGRNSAGKYPLDVSELRIAFNLSAQITERIKSFISERTYSLEFGEFQTIDIAKGGTLVLHCIPLSSFTSKDNIDISDLKANKDILLPIFYSGFNYRINLEGIVNYITVPQGPSRAYTQIYRNGIIESAVIIDDFENNNKSFHIFKYEERLFKTVENVVEFYNRVEIEPPIFIFLTILNFKGFKLARNSSYISNYSLDRNHVSIPEITIISYSEKVSDQLKSMFDILWNSFGYEKSLFYNDNGHRI